MKRRKKIVVAKLTPAEMRESRLKNVIRTDAQAERVIRMHCQSGLEDTFFHNLPKGEKQQAIRREMAIMKLADLLEFPETDREEAEDGPQKPCV